MKAECSLQYFCEHQDKMDLLQEWDWGKNAPLTPDTVHKGSHLKVWWHCENGHTWLSEIRVRANGSLCPYCTKRMIWVESNDLLTLNPALASEWDNEKNGKLKPSDVLEGSNKYAWWKCQNGHSWRARILSRSRGAGCPFCTGKAVMPGENDLATLFPSLAAQWDTEHNGIPRPDQVSSFSNRKVWWRCTLDHEWQAIIAARVAENSGCPYCAGRRVLAGFNDLATLYPKIAAQWDAALNGSLTPEMVTPGSHKRVWWRCGEGHVWKTAVYSRTGKQKCGCPVCAGKTKQPSQYVRP